MNTTDLHAAFLLAGNDLQPYGNWLLANWANLTIAAALLAFAVWAVWFNLRRAIAFDRKQEAALAATEAPILEPGTWGPNAGGLETCNAILIATNDQARKGE